MTAYLILAIVSLVGGFALGLKLTESDNTRLRKIASEAQQQAEFQYSRAESWMSAAMELGDNAIDLAHDAYKERKSTAQ